MIDFIEEYWPLMLCGALALLIAGLCALAAQQDAAEQKAFMSECVTVHKRFECTVMWRASEAQQVPSVVPVPIVVGR